MTPSWPAIALFATLGLALGSYAVTAAMRWARAEPSHAGRSHCDACLKPLGFSETLPVISYLRQAGACRACGAGIDRLHLAGELSAALLLTAAVLTADSASRAILLSILGLLLIALSVTDLKVRRLPDALTGAVALVCAFLAWDRSPSDLFVGLVAALATFTVLSIVRRASARAGRDPGLGLGDIKLLTGLSVWLGLATPWAIAASALMGLASVAVLRPKDGLVPFGPMIAIAGLGVGYLQEITRWPALT